MLRAVFVSDLHVGSHTALCDPAASNRSSPGKEIQKALFNKWRAAATGQWARPDALIVNGDAVDGQGSKQGGVHQWTTDPVEQVAHAVELINMWKAKRVYIIGGSGYHVQIKDSGVSAEEMLGEKLHAEEYPNQEHIKPADRRRSGPQWFLTFERATVHVAHHVSVSKVFAYMSTPIAREMMAAKLNDPMRHAWQRMYAQSSQRTAALDLMESMSAFKTRWVIRGHAHYFWLCDSGGMIGCNLPAWKCPDPWLQEKNTLANGHIGFLGMKINGDEISYEKNICGAEDVSQIPHTVI